VAAARAYVLSNPDTILAEHLRIEEKMAAGNPPEVRDQARRARSTLLSFKEWLAEQAKKSNGEAIAEGQRQFPTFREWLSKNAID
jgi:hypothetical protein